MSASDISSTIADKLANTKGRNCFRTKNGFKSYVYIITLSRFPYSNTRSAVHVSADI
jgi:hypothetical protein